VFGLLRGSHASIAASSADWTGTATVGGREGDEVSHRRWSRRLPGGEGHMPFASIHSQRSQSPDVIIPAQRRQ
jgi:hypothetical protein